jgi:hypothetical protein
MKTRKPNLFAYATSELSQDAFIAWLLAWADPRYAHYDVALHGTSVHVLQHLLNACGIPTRDPIKSVMVQRQYKKIDVVVVVNQRIAIGIEDKIHTIEHSGQLDRCRQILSEGFGSDHVGVVYLKTGDQGKYPAGYVRFGRTDFLRALRYGRQLGLRNDIIDEFVDHLERIEASRMRFRKAAPSEWDRDCWIGFFVELQRHLLDTDWGYVPTKSGGFMGFWWKYTRGIRIPYLQLEEKRLCFKIEVEEEAQRRSRWEEWNKRLKLASTIIKLPIRTPTRRSGTWMTVATFPHEYRKLNGEGLLDLDATLRELRLAEQLLAESVRDYLGKKPA